jgi:hypothetical protein
VEPDLEHVPPDSTPAEANAHQQTRLIEIALATGAAVACRNGGYHRCGNNDAERDAFAAVAAAFELDPMAGRNLQFVVIELSRVLDALTPKCADCAMDSPRLNGA